MTYRWNRFLKVSKSLLSIVVDEESRTRSSINRAYYAAFGEARMFSERKGLVTTRRRSVHEQVWQFLRRGGNAPSLWEAAARKAIGDQGIALRDLRNKADYDPAASVTVSDARGALQRAGAIIKRLDGLP